MLPMLSVLCAWHSRSRRVEAAAHGDRRQPLEGRPADRPPHRRCRRASTRGRPGERIVVPPERTRRPRDRSRRCTSSGDGSPRAHRIGHRQRRPRARRRRHDRGLRRSTDAAAATSGATPPAFTSPRRRVTIRDCRIGEHAVRHLPARGRRRAVSRLRDPRACPGKAPGEKGSGIHVWNTQRFTLDRQRDRRRARRLLHPVVVARRRSRGNIARDLRYGLHYMFSDDNVFEDNVFENGAAGAALMYSKRITFRRNRFLHNRGFASVGLLFKACDDVAGRGQPDRRQRARHVPRRVVPQRVPPQRHRRRRTWPSCSTTPTAAIGSRATRFVGNLSPLTLVGQAHRHALRRQLLVGERRAGPRRRRDQRPAVPSGERLRSPARQPLGRRPVGAEASPRRRWARPSGRSRSSRRSRSSTRTRWRARRLPRCRGGDPRWRAAAAQRWPWSRLLACLGGGRRAFGRAAAGPAGGGRDRVPRVHQALRGAASRSTPCHARDRPRRGRRAARPERLGQDDVDQGRGGPDPADERRGAARRAAQGRPSMPATRRARARSCRSAWRFPEALTGREVVEFYRAPARTSRARPHGRGAEVCVAERRRRARGRHVLGRDGAAARAGGGDAARTRRCCCSTSRPRRSIPTGCALSTASSSAPATTGATVLFSSHQLGDVERLADRFARARRRAARRRSLRSASSRSGWRIAASCACGSQPAVDGLLERVRALAPRALWAGDELIVPGPAVGAARGARPGARRPAATSAASPPKRAGSTRSTASWSEAASVRALRHASLLALAAAACAGGPPAPAALDTAHESCRFCRMVVSDQRFAAQIVAPREEPLFFDDLGCLQRYVSQAAALPPGAFVYVADHRTRRVGAAAAARSTRACRAWRRRWTAAWSRTQTPRRVTPTGWCRAAARSCPHLR